jgi:hypothetical protein
MIELEEDMAQHFYGYGRWDAPYWFIGPEQGQEKKENDNLGPRARAWKHLGQSELVDLKSFHDQLEQGMHTREKARLQPTWKKLLLLLLSYKGETASSEDRRAYQRLRLGRSNGETCLIELSGLPANNSSTTRDRERFFPMRIGHIGDALKEKLKRPTVGFVVMYGKGSHTHFRSIFGSHLEQDVPIKVGSTVIVSTTHPNTRGISNRHWCALGESLRAVQQASQRAEKVK